MSGIESIVATGATTPAVDLLRRLAGPEADQVGLMLGDKAWEYRANNLIKITVRLQRKLRAAGLPANAVPPAGGPLIAPKVGTYTPRGCALFIAASSR